jgi:hypothetical protein
MAKVKEVTMRRWKLYLIVTLGLFFLSFSTVIACSQPPAAVENKPAPKPAEFEVGPIIFKPPVVMVGDSVAIEATVNNSGDLAGTYTAILLLDGHEAGRKDINVEPGSSQEVSFQLSQTVAGSHQLVISSSSAALTVNTWKPYTIQYDQSDGVSMGIYVSGENGHIVHFTPPNKAFKIQKIKIFGMAKNATIFSKNIVTAKIWDKEANNLIWSQDFPWPLFLGADWHEIKVPDIRVNDDFQVELVTHSDPAGGDPIDFDELLQLAVPPNLVIGKVPSLIIIGFDYPKSCVNPPVNCPETRSGYSYMGKLIDPGQGRLKGINWLIRVEGEGASSSP